MTTHPGTSQPRESDGKFGTKPLAEAIGVDLTGTTNSQGTVTLPAVPGPDASRADVVRWRMGLEHEDARALIESLASDGPDSPDGREVVDAAEAVRLDLVSGFKGYRDRSGDTEPWPQERTYTLYGHWDGNEIVVEGVLDGETQDERPETGYWSEGLWASSAPGRTMQEVATRCLIDYDEASRIREALSEDDFTPDDEFDDECEHEELDPDGCCEECGEPVD